MDFLVGLMSFVILVVVLAIAYLLGWGLAEITTTVEVKRQEKWHNSVFSAHPELKLLLSEYCRLRTEHTETLRDMRLLRKNIDEWVEKNKYLPKEHRVDGHIEELKKHYQELLEIEAKQDTLEEEAKKDLEWFWEHNYPEVDKIKRIMWWDE